MSNFDDDIPVARGRRDPHLASMLDAERPLMDDEPAGAVQGEPSSYQLLPGDMIMGKTTFAYQTPSGDAWSTFGAQTHILDGEDTEDGFDRLSAIVNGGAIAMAEDAIDRISELHREQQERERTRRITGHR